MFYEIKDCSYAIAPFIDQLWCEDRRFRAPILDRWTRMLSFRDGGFSERELERFALDRLLRTHLPAFLDIDVPSAHADVLRRLRPIDVGMDGDVSLKIRKLMRLIADTVFGPSGEDVFFAADRAIELFMNGHPTAMRYMAISMCRADLEPMLLLDELITKAETDRA